MRRGINSGLTLPNRTVIYPREKIPFYNIIIQKLQFGYRFKNVIKNIKTILKNILISFVGKNINNINPALFRDDSDGNKTD